MDQSEQLKHYWKLLADWLWRETGKTDAICDSCGRPMSRNSGFYSPFIFGNELFCKKCVERRIDLTLENITADPDPFHRKEFTQALLVSKKCKLKRTKKTGPMRTEDALNAIEGLSPDNFETHRVADLFVAPGIGDPSESPELAAIRKIHEEYEVPKKWWQFWRD